MKKNIIIFGIVNSVATLVYALTPIFSKSFSPLISNLIPLIAIPLLSLLAAYFYKRDCPQLSSFKHLFLVTFSGQAIGQVLGIILIIIVFNFIPEETKLTLANEYIDNHFEFFSKISGSDSMELLDSLESEADNLFSINKLQINIFGYLIFNILVSFIVAMFMKKEYA